jgi:uncharacterized membrane protein
VNLLVAGVLLWSIVHLFPALATHRRQALMARLGNGPYRGLFALLIISSTVCIVLGWRSTAPVAVYTPPPGMRPVTLGLMVVALILFVSARAPTDLKQFIRHPQLTGVLTWAIAHLLSNGDSRSLVLFGGIGLWTIVEMIAINARDGRWCKPEPVGAVRSCVPVLIGAIAWIVLGVAHPWFAGVPVFVRG